MLRSARHSLILQAVTSRGSCSVAELARELEVSGETIRRDIKAMAHQGLLRKVHGGASLPDHLRESSFRRRLMELPEAKQAIATRAAQEVQNGDSLMIDTGSTTTYVARALGAHRDLLVVTNSTEIARTLAKGNGNRVFLVGGELRGDDGALFGAEAARFVERFRTRMAILSMAAIDLAAGFLDFHPEEAEFSRVVIAQAARVLVAADHSKFGRQAPVRVCGFDQVDLLISDRAPPPVFAERLAAADVEVVAAG